MAFTNIIDIIYPVGTIYTSFSSTSPATLFGGTWTRIKTFLYGQDSSGDTGGTTYHSHIFGITYGEYYRNLVAQDNVSGGQSLIWVANNSKYTYNSGLPLCVDQNGDNIESQLITNSIASPWRHTTNYNTAADMVQTASPTCYSQFGPTSYEQALPPYTTCFIWQRTA